MRTYKATLSKLAESVYKEVIYGKYEEQPRQADNRYT